jgi:glutaredoxin
MRGTAAIVAEWDDRVGEWEEGRERTVNNLSLARSTPSHVFHSMQSILNAIRKAFSPAEVSPDQLAAAKTTVEVCHPSPSHQHLAPPQQHQRKPTRIVHPLTPSPQNLISSSRVAVFSKAYCPYCKRASALLETRGYGSITKTIQLDQVKDGSTIQSYLAQRGGVSRVTVPQVSPIFSSSSLRSLGLMDGWCRFILIRSSSEDATISCD